MTKPRAIDKNRTTRRLLQESAGQIPKGTLGDNVLLIDSLLSRIRTELGAMAKTAQGEGVTSWGEAQASVHSILKYLSGISVASARAMDSFVDTINEEIVK